VRVRRSLFPTDNRQLTLATSHRPAGGFDHLILTKLFDHFSAGSQTELAQVCAGLQGAAESFGERFSGDRGSQKTGLTVGDLFHNPAARGSDHTAARSHGLQNDTRKVFCGRSNQKDIRFRIEPGEGLPVWNGSYPTDPPSATMTEIGMNASATAAIPEAEEATIS
jgi:hypothetical protein